MTQENATSFVADGPTLRGFETGGANITIGVFARGLKIGVHGIGADSNSNEQVIGVLGETSNGVGVQGTAPQTGVSGISTSMGTGVHGESEEGTGVRGFSSGRDYPGYGGSFSSDFSQIWLQPASSAGHPRTGSHKMGELFVDKEGALYYCTATGTPGTWKKVLFEERSLLDRLVAAVARIRISIRGG